MLVIELAVVSETERITHSQLSRVVAALQKQAIRDFRGVWEVTATVDGFEKLEDVPVGYWPIIVRDDIGEAPGVAGYHHDKDGQPFSLVKYSDSWSLTASHEMLEMLGDPWGSRLVAGPSPKPDQGRVEFLVEVSDPPQAAQFGYTVNGFLVSDFITPNFYDPVATTGVRYSFGGHVPGPRQIARGGYISWHEPATDHWWQQVWFTGNAPRFRDLGILTGRTGSLRAAIDARTRTALRVADTGPESDKYAAARTLTASITDTTTARAANWHTQIDMWLSGQVAEGTWEDGEDEA